MPTSQPHIERIVARDGAWKLAASRRDLDGMMAIYAADAMELLPDMPAIVGRDAIREFYRGLLARFPQFVHDFTMDEIVIAASGDLAVVRGTYRFVADRAHLADAQTGKFVGVWRHRHGEWHLYLNIANGDGAATA